MVLVECKTEKGKGQCEHGQPMVQIRSMYCTCDSGVLAVNHNTSVTTGEFIYVQSELHGQMSLAAVNQILCSS